MKRAIAYLRFSSLQQVHGDSVRRQKKLIDEWLKQNPDYYLDPVTFEDMGLSAWRGQHAARGAFSVFMAAVNGGFIGGDCALLIESLDRLSREKIGDAIERLRAILKAGIDVVTLSEGTHYTRDSLDDPYAIIKAILIAQRANEESELKSRRLRAAWAEKRNDAAESGKIMTTKCPYWLKVNDTRTGFDILEDKATVIRSIFSMRLEGMSYTRISRVLNARGAENLKGKISQWNSSSIERLLRKKAVVGYLVPSHQMRTPDAEEIPGYYPSIISMEEYERAQLIHYEPESRKDNNFNPFLINVFKGLMRCKLCGHAVILTGISVKGYGYYVCSMRRENRCHSVPLRRDVTDRYLITGLIKGASGMDLHHNHEESVRSVTARRLELTGRLQNIIRAIEITPDVTELSERARTLTTEIRALDREMSVICNKRGSRAAAALNVLNINDRKACQQIACGLIREIRMDASAKTCDVFLHNGMKLYNYPLTRQVGWSSIVDAMAFLEQNEVFL